MVTSWFYAHDDIKLGPFSPTQLKDLAAAGAILPIDTVWLEGNEQGVPASRVKHLFARAVSGSSPASAGVPFTNEAKTIPADLTPGKPLDEATPPPETTPAPAEKIVPPDEAKPKAKERPAKKGRATAVSGADLVSQDGVQARYRKKCMKCGHKDAACHMVSITNKTYKSIFFCPKCRKKTDVVIQCHM